MELFLILLPLLGVILAGPIAQGLDERIAVGGVLACAMIGAVLAWVLLLTGGPGEPRNFGLWFESGTLSVEFSLYADALARPVVVAVASFMALAQLQGFALQTPKALAKAGESQRLRLLGVLSLLTAALQGFAMAGSFATLAAAGIALAFATGMAVDFNIRSQLAGRSASKALIVSMIGAVAVLTVAAFAFVDVDTDAFDVVFDRAGEVQPGLSGTAIIVAGIAFAALLPALPWTLGASEAPAALAATLQAVVPAAGLFLLLRLSPLGATDLPIAKVAMWAAVATALFGAAASIVQNDLARALSAAALVPISLAACVAFAGDSELALLLSLVNVATLLLIWVAYSTIISRVERDAELRQLGGMRGLFRGPSLAVLLGTLVATGFGLPFAVGSIAISLPGYAVQSAALALLETSHPALFWLFALVLGLYALALWRLYVLVFLGEARSKKARLEPEDVFIAWPTRFTLGVLALLAFACIPLLGSVPADLAGTARFVPILACAFGFLMAVFGLKAVPRVEPVSSVGQQFWGIKRLYETMLERPTAALGQFVSGPFERVFLGQPTGWIAERLLPKLAKGADQAQEARAFPYVVGTVVAGALIVTLVTMAGG